MNIGSDSTTCHYRQQIEVADTLHASPLCIVLQYTAGFVRRSKTYCTEATSPALVNFGQEDTGKSPNRFLAWCSQLNWVILERVETIEGIQRGLADVKAGRTPESLFL
jgi:hypothetical protein